MAHNARATHSERTSSVAERYMKKLYEKQAEDAPIIMCFADSGELWLVIVFMHGVNLDRVSVFGTYTYMYL